MAGAKNKPEAVSSFAGATGGTGLVGLANLITDPSWRAILLYVSPAATVGISIAWLYTSSIMRNKYRRSQMNKMLAEARAIRDRVLSDGASSDDHKKNVQENVEKLEHLAMQLINDETESVRASLTSIG